jgi:hypothetical protein
VSHLQCPECRLTVPAAAYYLRGDQCPRCLTSMVPYERPKAERTTPRPAAPTPPGLRGPELRGPELHSQAS